MALSYWVFVSLCPGLFRAHQPCGLLYRTLAWEVLAAPPNDFDEFEIRWSFCRPPAVPRLKHKRLFSSDRSQAVLRRDPLRLRRESAALIASALRCKPWCSAVDISGSSTRCTPSRPMTLGKESVTPNAAL